MTTVFGTITLDERAAELVGEQISHLIAAQPIRLWVRSGLDAWNLVRTVEFVEFQIARIIRLADLDSVEGTARAERLDLVINEIAPWIGQVPPGEFREYLLTRISGPMGLSSTTLAHVLVAGHGPAPQMSAPVLPRQSADNLDD